MLQKYLLLILLQLVTIGFVHAQTQNGVISGVISGNEGPLPAANIQIAETEQVFSADESGAFRIEIAPGVYTLKVSYVGYEIRSQEVKVKSNDERTLKFELEPTEVSLKGVEVFGERSRQPEKLATLTRLPLRPVDQIQSISVISDKLITLQGGLTISETARNVPGVYTFATYGNQRESMSARGYRGIPILKNGVRINSDFRGVGILTDMQGVESLQVLKGSAAVTQGVATDLGSPGGVINIVTKTPQFINRTGASLRVGSFGQFRPAFDVQGVLDKNETIAVRVNGAYERKDGYRPGMSGEKIYVNPSLSWRPDARTTITVEMDYLDDNRTPDPGTVNLASNDTNKIYDLPYDRFLGFETNNSQNVNTSYAARLIRELNSNLSFRLAFIKSNLSVDAVTTSVSSAIGGVALENYNERYRTIGGSSRIDNNSVLQLDLIGQNVQSGFMKHTFQVGVDYRTNYLETTSRNMAHGDYIDVIDVFQPISNKLPSVAAFVGNPDSTATLSLVDGTPNSSTSQSFGVMAQDVITFNRYMKAFIGLRFSSMQSTSSVSDVGITRGEALNPIAGLMLSPMKGLNLFGSYTSSTSLRGATNVDINGNELGDQRIDQIEAGLKSEWFNKKLRFNLTLYKINNKNMSLAVYDSNGNPTGYYEKGGNDERIGLEAELIGRLFNDLEIVAGYAYIDAQYKEHNAFYEGSAPLNTPKHTANAWLNYTFNTESVLHGLNLGAGFYYIGERPVNDWSAEVTHEGIVPHQKPFDIEAYSSVNAYVGYRYKNYGVRVLVNNIFNEIGYNAYRTRFINQTDPRNFAVVLSAQF